MAMELRMEDLEETKQEEKEETKKGQSRSDHNYLPQ